LGEEDLGMNATTTTGLRIEVLGPLRAERDGTGVDLGGPKQRAVLAMIVSVATRSIGRDRIIQGVWGEEASNENRHTFYTYLSNLRGLLGDVIVRTGDTYSLAVEPDHIDHLLFVAKVDEARRVLATDSGMAAMTLREALGLWRGRPYADLLEFPGLEPEVRRLEELRLEAVELRVEAELAVGLHGPLVAELDALAEEHPMRERFRAQHMLALYRSGRQADALRAYRRTESFLAQELGVEPSEELRDLELKILEHDDSLLVGPGRAVTQRLGFLVTDIEGSTRLWDRHPRAMATALATHDGLLRRAIEAAGGRLFKHTGDGVLAAFPDSVSATQAAETAQRSLEAAEWGEVDRLRVRMGIDVGEAEARGGDFFGPPLNRAARLCAIGHGGQVLVSAAAQTEVVASAPAGVQIRQLGEYKLRGMANSERVAELVFVGLPADFPDLRVDAEPTFDDRTEILSLPGYEVRDRIGEGVFGVVWRAYQPSVGREVAVKMIRPELASQPSFVRRFEAEARTIARVAHPHIVPLIDFWRDTTSAYLVLALLPGGSVATAMAAGSLDRAAARRILSQVGAALDHAHSLGMAHGDVKPSNVLLDGAGNAYLSDFGIAARLLYPEVISSVSTDPAYRAPEETEDSPSPAGDLYALGVLAGELLDDDASEIEPIVAKATAFVADDRYRSAAALLADLDEVLGEEPVDVVRPVVSRNPYKGLRAFEEGDAADFYGRGELVSTLITACAEHRFVTVVGPSGSGKSSAVRAGLLPALAAGDIDGSDKWFRISVTPGSDPMAALAEGLETVSSGLVSTGSLSESGLRAIADGGLVVVIDQFEELYTLTNVADREAFIQVIVDSIVDPESEVRVVAALRADFYDRPLQDHRLGRLVRDGLVTVLPPTHEELTEMVTAPAHKVGLRWEPGLSHRIADDVSSQGGALPLLQYALTELVERRSGDLLNSGDYENIGGVAGALANRAEAVFTQLSPPQQRAAQQVLLRLVIVDEDSDDTRRRVRRSELESIGIPRADLDGMLDNLIAQRLLLADRDPATRGPTVEVAHEALLREWPRLRGWIDDQREALILGRRFRASLSEWESNDRHPDYLLTGSRLAPFAGWAETASLTPEELGYYQASRSKDEEDRNARRRRRHTLTGILVAAAVVSSILGIVAGIQGRQASEEADRAVAAEARAESEARLARARELSAAAVAAVDSDPALAKLLAVASADLADPTANTLSVLHQAYALDPVEDQYHWPLDRKVVTLGTDLHPLANRLVASEDLAPFGTSRYLEVYDFETDSVVWSWETKDPTVAVAQVRYSADGALVLAGTHWIPQDEAAGGDRPSNLLGLHIFDADTGDLLRRIDLGRCGGVVEGVSEERVLVSTSNHETCDLFPSPVTLEMVELESGERSELSSDFWTQASLSADGSYAAFTDVSGEEGPRMLVLEIETGRRIFEQDAESLLGTKPTHLLNQDASLAIAGRGPWEVWDVAEGLLRATFSGHDVDARYLVFAADGESVYSVGSDGTLRLWNARRGAEIASYPAAGGGRVSIADDGLILVADPAGPKASLLDLTPGEVWGVDTCHGFVLGGTLQVLGRSAVLTEVCPSDEWVTYVIDTTDREVVASYPGQASQDIRISPDGTSFVRQNAVESSEGSETFPMGPPVISDLETGNSLVELEAPDFPLYAQRFVWSPDGSLVVAVDQASRNVVVWSAETGQLLHIFPGCDGGWYPMFSDDGRQLFKNCFSNELVTISTETWEQTGNSTLPIQEPLFAFLGYDREGTSLLLLSGLAESGGSLHWINAETFDSEHTIHDSHAGRPTSWAMSLDRSRAATGASDGWVKVWDVESRELEQEFRISTQVQGVAFVDEDHLAVAPQTGGVYVYTLDPEELVNTVRGSLNRGFTDLECQQYNFGDDCPSLEELRGDG
jgi:DNA-binding SARP family transcriptional activator/WD40 repeat protein